MFNLCSQRFSMHFLDSNSSDVNLQPCFELGSAEWCSWDCDVNLQPGLGQQSGGSFCEKVTQAAETDASGRRCPDDLTAQPAS